MARTVDEDELIERWTLVGEELTLLAGKRGPTRLAFALMLKFHQQHGRFPRGRSDLPEDAVEFVARAVKVPARDLGLYEWDGRTSKYHRTQIRAFTGFRECGVADAEKATEWLTEHVCQAERRSDRVRAELLAHLRDEGIEPPTKMRLLRIIGSGLEKAEKTQTLRIAARVPAASIEAMLTLIAPRSAGDEEGEDQEAGSGGADVFAAIREEPGNVSVRT
ncbi:MAG: DUF4158 domain-containing protein, partial [Pseudonocardiaceae bacterium]